MLIRSVILCTNAVVCALLEKPLLFKPMLWKDGPALHQRSRTFLATIRVLQHGSVVGFFYFFWKSLFRLLLDECAP